MKKILALTLTSIFLLGGSGAAVATAATAEPCNVQAEQPASAQGNLYLVPGTYISGGKKKMNTITASGVRKLTDVECNELYTENAYICSRAKGEKLPKPKSTRKDKDGNDYSFNGWWAIVDATVTYFDVVPDVTESIYLYADWRADLSQRKDPVKPEEGDKVEPNHYMVLKHADNTEERITLLRGFTNLSTAETLGYAFAAELKVEGLELKPGDSFMVYTTGLVKDSNKAELSPIGGAIDQMWSIDLEKSGEKENDTADYLSAETRAYYTVDPVITYVCETEGVYNLYIKYFSKGSKMAVYMEPMGLN